ncbi:MAG: glycosyltransferase family 2 protein [Planctomycetia bacterium]|nr:glycosyltransferase family 2 protein [Planctomycetia bacterium]
MNGQLPELSHDCDLSLFIACYNEEQGIVPTIETVVAAATEVGISYDIVIIDDCSTDRSVEMIVEHLRRHPELPITLYVNEVNQGLGANFAEAAFRGRGKYYRLICGDNVESKETLVSIFRHLGEADMIIPYPADTTFRGPFRRFVSWSYTRLVNLLSGYSIRYYNGLAVNFRYNVMRWHSNSHGFGFQADLITRLLDLKATYIEVPVYPNERAGGETKAFRFRNICSVAHTLLEIFIRRLGKLVYPEATRRPLAQLRVYRAGDLGDGQVVSTITEQDSPDGIGKPAGPAP